ncbi:acetoacetate-CoA ligase [Penicillium fimorum]|uniref:Acetoacetate-CoA ligase n=1 Tax=Penicillium fimorum TaxID=1882269 RepID=A0A9X0CC52_9EURO|nr:acetoacetate-CoA ligase [Penicillium fimorum]
MSPPPLTKLWQHPDIANTNIESFRRLANERHSLNLRDYHDIWKWSTESLNAFWMLAWEFTHVKASVHPTYAIAPSETARLTPTPMWFPEARLNFAQNFLETAYIQSGDINSTILTGLREGEGELEDVSLYQLRHRVGLLANALRRSGIQQLDRVACVSSNSINTLVVFLAVSALGATFTCCSPEMGENGILDRFLQVKPKILFADDWIVYNNQRIPCLEKAIRLASHLRQQAGLLQLVIIPRFDDEYSNSPTDQFDTLEAFLAGASKSILYEQLKFMHPLIIVYSSGTTGPPKCLVHTVGGVLMKQKVEQILCMDMNPSSVYFQYTTTSWIMYLYAVSGLLSGARSILYDGSPVKPTVHKFLKLLAHQRVTHFGTSAHYLSLLEEGKVTNKDVSEIDSLKVITSTGSVLTESQYHWVYNTFGPVQLSSMSGGTDIAGAFVGGAPNLPVYAGWCQARTLGMKVQIYSEEGEAIEDTGKAGELVCTAPFPSLPISFWGDEDNKRYKAAYFERFAGVWHQGDFIQMEPTTQGIQFLGRSDNVLNPSGIRFGSAEIYNVLSVFTNIEDSLCVGQRRTSDKDEQVLLFIKMKDGFKCDWQLRERIKSRIRHDLSSRHVPKYIFQTPEIPMTTNGKKTETVVRKIVSGQKITPSSTIINPECLTWYEQFAGLNSDFLDKLFSKL